MRFSLLWRDVEFEMVPFIRANGLGLMVWAPLAGGFLTDKYTRDQRPSTRGSVTRQDAAPASKSGRITGTKTSRLAGGARPPHPRENSEVCRGAGESRELERHQPPLTDTG